MTPELKARLYQHYATFKGWSEAPSPGLDGVFATEAARAGIPRQARLLEIGFGAGEFLEWAKRRGHAIVGVETSEDFCRQARARGHEAHAGSLGELSDLPRGAFDAIFAFDVLEHMEMEELVAFLTAAEDLLKPGGRLLARFPNGASPFGRAYQYGDATHVSVLSPETIRQLGQLAGLSLSQQADAARPVRGTSDRLARLCRHLVGSFISWTYYRRILPLDPNVTVVLEKRRPATGAA